MKKIKSFVFALCLMLLAATNVYAECSTKTLNELKAQALKVEGSFEVKTEEWTTEGYIYAESLTEEEKKNYKNYQDVFNIYISNITEDIYVTVTESSTKDTKTYYYKDTENGRITIKDLVSYTIKKYTIEVYANGGDCAAQKLRTLEVTTPMYNKYSEYAQCEGIEDYYLCQKYLKTELNFDKFYENVAKYKDVKEKEEIKNKEQENKEKKNKNTIIIIITVASILVLGAGGTAFVILREKKKINQEKE